jgi:hypothetical protein
MGLWESEDDVTMDNTPYDATSWDGNDDAATKNAIRDKIETFVGGGDMLKSVYDADNDGIVDQVKNIDGGTF